MLEAPSQSEIAFELRPTPGRQWYGSAEECETEIEIRRRDYPEFEPHSLRVGVPAVGPTGNALFNWILARAGIRREDCFLDQTIRCLPPRGKNGTAYPTGEARKAAEQHCRQYDRLGDFRPDTIVFSIHPAGLLREITPLPLLIKDFERVRDFAAAGRRVLSLLGGKATHGFARYGENVTRWRGHYAALPSDWSETYKSLFFYRKKEKKVRKVKEKI